MTFKTSFSGIYHYTLWINWKWKPTFLGIVMNGNFGGAWKLSKFKRSTC